MYKTILILLTLTVFSCSNSKIISVVTQGSLAQKEFNKELKFNYLGKHIFIDVSINGETYSFLFDTGYEISQIDKNLFDLLNFQPIKKYKTSGSSFKEQKIQYGFLDSLSINDITFQNIGIGIQDLSFIKSPFEDDRKIAGVIGTNILRKAHWQIDYSNQTIRFSDRSNPILPDPEAFAIEMTPRNKTGWGYNKVTLFLDGLQKSFILDTGSSGNFTGNIDLLQQLKANDPNVKPVESIINIGTLELGKLRLNNIPLSIEKDVALLIGNTFLEDYIVTIDWSNNNLYLLPIQD